MAGRIDDLIGMLRHPRDFWYYYQRLFQNVERRQRIARYIARRRPQAEYGSNAISHAAVVSLRSDGIALLPNLLDAQQVTDILNYALAHNCYDRTRPENGEFNIKSPHPECHTAVYSPEITIKCPHVLDAVNNPAVLATVSELMGCKPTLSDVSLWWSLPGHLLPEHAEYFHRDVDDWLFVKLFIYITDVDAEAGPHVFVRGSHNNSRLTKIARYSDEKVEETFGPDNVMQMHGPAGTNFLENTYGMHKGQLPKSKRRLLLQAQYSLGPISLSKYKPQSISNSTACLIDPYINRLYVC